jgi:hypothetical protein
MPKEVLERVRALMRDGMRESNAYAIAVAAYERKHGHPPRMHKVSKAVEGAPPGSELPQERGSDRQLIITPEMIMQEQLVELRRIRELLEKIEKKPKA